MVYMCNLTMYVVLKSHECVLYVDNNECMDGTDGGCGQLCVNSLGSFSCDCREGFSLASDGTSCTGKAYSSHTDDSMNVNCIASVYNTPGITLPVITHTCTKHETVFFVLFTLTKLYFTTLHLSHSTANPCAKLGRPAHGNITCTGIQVTDESCSFDCDLGYSLQGSDGM